MWCKVCNLEITEKICPTCGALTEKDIDREVFGVSTARYLDDWSKYHLRKASAPCKGLSAERNHHL